MKIHHVTATGADESVWPGSLARFHVKWDGKIEWGILYGKQPTDDIWADRSGPRLRFPHGRWLRDARQFGITASLHYCGAHVVSIVEDGVRWLHGDWSETEDKGFFARSQLNFAGRTYEGTNDLKWLLEAQCGMDWILSMDGVNDFRFHAAREGRKASDGANIFLPLHDRSFGNGALTIEWPKPIPGVMNGYAGGLNPENIVDQLKRIEDVVRDAEIWIDFESGARDEQDQFCLKRVGRVMEAASVYF